MIHATMGGVSSARAGRAAVEIVGDVANFGKDVERGLNNELREVKVDVSPVSDGIRDGVRDGVRASGKEFDGLSEQARQSFKGVGEEADTAGERIGSGVRKGTNQARDELGRFTKANKRTFAGISMEWLKLPKILGGIGKLAGTALTGAIGAAAIANSVTSVMQLTAALAPAVGAVGPLAAAFIANKIAAGTFQLAIMGVQDALSAGLTGDTKAFTEALEAMPKTAQAAVKEAVGLKKEILGVREVVQGNFFGPLVGQIKPLGSLYLPMVANGLGRISTGFGTALRSAGEFLRTPTAVKAVSSALMDTGTAVNQVTAGLPGLVRAFLPIWQVGASFLPGLTAGFDDLTQRVGAFIERAAASGKLQQFFSAGLSTLGELAKVLGNIGSILLSVFQAGTAGGGQFLGILGQVLQTAAEFLNSAEGFSVLTQVFAVLGQAGALVGQVLKIILPIVGQLVTVLAGALAPVIPVISSLISALAPVLTQVGTVIASLLGPAVQVLSSLLSTLVPVIMPIVSSIVGALLPAVQGLMPIITALGTVIGSVLSAALTALQPLFAALIPVMQQIAVQVLPSLLPLIQSLGDLLLALMPIIQPLIGLLVVMINSGLQQFVTVMPPVLAALNGLVQAITYLIGPIASAIGWVLDFISTLLQGPKAAAVVQQGWQNLKTSTNAVFGFIRAFITAVISNIKSVLMSIGAAISAVVGFFGRMRSAISSALSAARAAVASAVSAIGGFFGRLQSAASAGVNRMVAVVRGIGGRIRSAVGNLGGLLVAAGRNVIQGLIDGIGAKLGALRAKAASAASTIRNLFPFSPAKEGPLSGSGSPEIAGRKIATMIAGGLESRIPAIRAAAFRAADTARLSTAPIDTSGRGILAAALGSATAQPKFQAAPSAASGVTFAAGAVVLNFYGKPPTEDEAFAAGRAAGRGLATAMQSRGVKTTMRTI